MDTKRWTVDIFIDEHDDQQRTRAEARLRTMDHTHLVGHGTARRGSGNHEVLEIGKELAVARALSELSHLLLNSAARDIEQISRDQHIKLTA